MLQKLQSISPLHSLKTHHGHKIPLSTRKSIIGCRALSPPLEAFLQVLGTIQPATKWTTDERPNAATFTPLDVDYNPVLLQSMPCALYLTHPDSLATTTRYLIRPPRLRSNLREDAYWAPWWRASILVQSPTSLTLLNMSAQNHHTTQGYLLHALRLNM